MRKIYYNFTFFILLTLSIYCLCQNKIIAQQQPEFTEFPVGSIIDLTPGNITNPDLLNSYTATGMNTIVCYADQNSKNSLTNFNVIPWNENSTGTDWIQHYVTGYYSMWEAEENKPFNDTVRVGIKHKYGSLATWKTKQCWSTSGISVAKDSVMFGPHYHQEKSYRRFKIANPYAISFTPRINMALHKSQTVNGSEDVCLIKVVHRYTIIDSNYQSTVYDTILLQRTLKVSDFNSDESFKDFYFNNVIPYYSYDERFQHWNGKDAMESESYDYLAITDMKENNGIQFCVDWLRNDNKCTLYVDYAEVYDNEGWNEFIDPLTHDSVITRIQNYTQSYSDWNNIKYWFGHDEPYTIDAIVPMKIVDSLVRDASGAPLITAYLLAVQPTWSPVNGELLYKRIYETAQPNKLMIDYYPFYYGREPYECLEILRSILAEAHNLQPGFWYFGQAFGIRAQNNNWCTWKKPSVSEFKALSMLILPPYSR